MARKIRISSGIKGLDQLMQGGFIKRSTTLVSGGTGTGKSIFLLQFILEGAKNNENGLFITLEEDPEELREDALDFGWDFRKYETEGKCKIVRFNPFELEDLKAKLESLIRMNDYKRVAIDSSSVFGMYKDDEYKTRKSLFDLIETLRKTDATTIISAEIPSGSEQLSRYGVEEFVVDGVIALYYLGIGEGIFRNISIKKMRRTDHAHGIFPMKIGKNGIEIVEMPA